MKSIKFTETIHIRERPEVIFDYTQDYGNRLQWDTFLKRADLVDGATAAGKGVKSYCVAKNGIGMETVYVSFNRPRATAVQMTRGPYLFKTFQGSWTFRALPDGGTEVIFLYSFTLRFPFSLAGFLVRRILQRNVRQRLVDLKTCIERNHPRVHRAAAEA
ncbi:MAG: SRPBCC family protein [Cytophagales bacterium]|nr:SRPBCC family protein [Cytophagales bacterium]